MKKGNIDRQRNVNKYTLTLVIFECLFIRQAFLMSTSVVFTQPGCKWEKRFMKQNRKKNKVNIKAVNK